MANQQQDDGIRNFEDVVEWCRANGWADHDFDGLKQRILELSRVMAAGAEANHGEKPEPREQDAVVPSETKLIYFVRRLPPKRSS